MKDGPVSCFIKIYTNTSNKIDVTFLAKFSALSTLGSIAQQIHYNLSWLIVKHDAYATALKAVETPALGFSGVGNNVDLVLFTIRKFSSRCCLSEWFLTS